MPWVKPSRPDLKERIIAGLSYLTFGIAGLIYIIASGRNGQTGFFNFHFRQAIVLWIICLLFGMGANALTSILSGTLGLVNGQMASLIVQPLMVSSFILDKVVYFVCLYGAIWAFLGKYAEVPFISNLVRQMR